MYLPGSLSENIQKVNYFNTMTEFNIPLYSGKFDDDINQSMNTLELKGGEVLKVRWFKPESTQTIYTYIEGYYKEKKYYEIESECSMSLDFVCINTVIFENITGSFERDMKIDKILEK
jgi:hypothetical protein